MTSNAEKDASPLPQETAQAAVPRSQHASLAHLVRWRREQTPHEPAFQYRLSGEPGWAVDTWDVFAAKVDCIAAALIDRGLRRGDCVALAATTSYEWLCVDFAVMSAGGTTTTIYPTSGAADVEHILSDSGACLVFAEGPAQVDHVHSLRARLPQLNHVVSFDESCAADDVESFESFLAKGRALLARDAHAVAARVDEIGPRDYASILYTSGTTGPPKGVLSTHESWLTTLEALVELGHYTEGDVQLLWLPLAHAFGKLLGMCGVRAGFLTAVDGDVNRIAENLALVRPTFMCAVPRVLEKVYGRVRMEADASPVKRHVFQWASRTALTVSDYGTRRIPWSLAAQYRVADALVLQKIRQAFGGRLRFLISGSAPLDPEIGRWFAALGIQVLEGYGLTESGAASTINRFENVEWGTVGKPLAGVEVRIADDGEVLLRSPGLMTRYYGDEVASAAALDTHGWLHTGDVGTMTAQGNLKITDRKKNVFKTANGKYIAPGTIEARFMALCPYAAQFVVVGESRRFVTALVGLEAEAIQQWAREHGMEAADFAALTRTDEVRELVQHSVDELNKGLNPWERVQKYVILPRELTIDDGDLTPSLKLRRRVVESAFASQIDEQYVEDQLAAGQ